MAAPLRIVFMGSDAIALPMLEWLAGQTEQPLQWAAIFTQPDRPVGRGQQVQANAIKTWALARGIPVEQPHKIADDALAAFAPDLVLVMAYGHILRDPVIQTPRLGTVNFHASLLPAYRGASPIQTAVAEGETETGVSLMRIVRKLDAGPVADVERVSILETDTALEVEQKLSAACVPLLRRNLEALVSGQLAFVEQEEARATFCRRLGKDDARVDFSQPARLVAARVNGLNPWPGGAVEWGTTPLKVGLAVVAAGETSASAPGTVLGENAAGLLVATGDGVVALAKLQRPGGKMLPAREFLRGCPIAPGTVFPSQPGKPLVGTTPFKYALPPKTV